MSMFKQNLSLFAKELMKVNKTHFNFDLKKLLCCTLLIVAFAQFFPFVSFFMC